MNAAEARHTRDLVQQLAEARATIDALLSGQIDAVVDAKSGMDAYLSKPIEPDALFDVVDRQLSRSSTVGDLSPAKPRSSNGLQSVAVPGTVNDLRP